MPTNGAGQGLLAEDWDVTTASTFRPATAPAAPESHPAPIDANDLPPAAAAWPILPDRVALLLDTALHGDRAPSGTPGADGRALSR